MTGATGGIGSAVVRQLLQSGAQVTGSYFQDQSGADSLQKQGAVMIRADLGNRDDVRLLVKKSLEQSGGALDALVYAAGNTRDHTLLKMTDDEWDAVIGVHLTGLVTACKELLPSMQQRKQGKIIAMGSQSGLTGRLGQANYSAAKAGAAGFIKTLAREAGRFGVTANLVCPGFVDSKMTRSAPPEAWERAKSASALGTISSAQTVASFITWMVSDHCAGVTGQIFQLDSRIL